MKRTTLALRALRLHCPHCGGGGLFYHWFAMKPVCPSCGLSLAPGNSVGAYILNLVATESSLAIGLVIVFVRTWPNPPWDLMQWLAPALMLVAPLIFFPFSKTLFVALDLAMHPGAQPDLLVHGVSGDG